MRKQNPKLHVKAIDGTNVHEIGPDGNFIIGHGQPRRIAGKCWNNDSKQFEVIPEGSFVFYHPEYIRHLKEGSLKPASIETAIAAGVTWNE